MPERSKVLFIGCGDIAQRAASRLDARRYRLVGLRRRVEQLPANIDPLALDLDAQKDLNGFLDNDFGFVVITLTPSTRTEAGYRQCYVTNVKKIVAALEKARVPPRRVIFVSSTSVYGQDAGDWVDEGTIAKPRSFNGSCVLEGEDIIRTSSLRHSVLRFSGIYGPGRRRLIDQVENGRWSAEDARRWSNRIHADDGAGFIAHLIHNVNETAESLYVISDNEPVLLQDVKCWLATKLGKEAPQLEKSAEGFIGKRCINKRLIGSGYTLKFGSYREGYTAMLRRQ